MLRGMAYPGTGEELSLKDPAAVSKCQLEFRLRYSQFLSSDWFSVLWRCGLSVVAHHLLLLGITCWFGEQDKDDLCCFQALNPSSAFFSLCFCPGVGTGEGGDDEQDKLLTPALQKSKQAILIIQQGEQKYNAMKSCKAMEMVSSPQTRATLQAIFGVGFLYGLK